MTQYTANELLDGITAALQAKDVKAAAALIAVLETVDPEQAEYIVSMLKMAKRGLL